MQKPVAPPLLSGESPEFVFSKQIELLTTQVIRQDLKISEQADKITNLEKELAVLKQQMASENKSLNADSIPRDPKQQTLDSFFIQKKK